MHFPEVVALGIAWTPMVGAWGKELLCWDLWTTCAPAHSRLEVIACKVVELPQCSPSFHCEAWDVGCQWRHPSHIPSWTIAEGSPNPGETKVAKMVNDKWAGLKMLVLHLLLWCIWEAVLKRESSHPVEAVCSGDGEKKSRLATSLYWCLKRQLQGMPGVLRSKAWHLQREGQGKKKLHPFSWELCEGFLWVWRLCVACLMAHRLQ